jgi:thiol-disulfide isomerase/thioredoxin
LKPISIDVENLMMDVARIGKVVCAGLILIVFSMLSFTLNPSSAVAGAKRPQTVQVGTADIPDFALKSVGDGSLVTSSKLKGKVLLFVFFATWCPPCIQEIPTLVDLQNEYGNRGFSVVGMSVDDGGPRVVKELMTKMGINYPVLMADGKTTRGFGGVSGIPVAFLVDRQGKRVKRWQGKVPHSVLEQEIKKYL